MWEGIRKRDEECDRVEKEERKGEREGRRGREGMVIGRVYKGIG